MSGAHLTTLEGHTGSILSVAFSPDGTHIVSGSEDYTLRLWDAVSGAHLNTLEGHTNTVRSVAFLLDGTRIVSESGSMNRHIIFLWDVATGICLDILPESSLNALAITHSLPCHFPSHTSDV